MSEYRYSSGTPYLYWIADYRTYQWCAFRNHAEVEGYV